MKGELIFGVNPVKESLQGTRGAFNLYVQIGASDHRVEKIIRLAEERGVAVHRRDKADLTRMCASSHHQGIALEVEPFRYADFDDLLTSVSQSGSPGFVLVLDAIQDPHNLGALIRSAACAGVDAVIIPKDRACGITAAAEKTSAGAVETVPVAMVTNVAQTLETLKNSATGFMGFDGAAKQSVYQTDFRKCCAGGWGRRRGNPAVGAQTVRCRDVDPAVWRGKLAECLSCRRDCTV